MYAFMSNPVNVALSFAFTAYMLSPSLTSPSPKGYCDGNNSDHERKNDSSDFSDVAHRERHVCMSRGGGLLETLSRNT